MGQIFLSTCIYYIVVFPQSLVNITSTSSVVVIGLQVF